MEGFRKRFNAWMWGPTSGSEIDISLEGKVVAITGANSGIGKVTALELSKKGARVLMLCRDTNKAQEVANDITDETRNEINVIKLDLASFEDIRSCADTLLHNEHQIDMLINNAGIMACPEMTTKDGLELQIGTNHFGHFLLTLLLLPLLRKSAANHFNPRIIVVSSMAHKGTIWPRPFTSLGLGLALLMPRLVKLYWAILPRFRMNWEDLHFQKVPGSYKPFKAYSQSKLANVLYAKELSRRLADEGIKVYCLHPGIISSELWRHQKPKGAMGSVLQAPFNYFMKTPFLGAQTTLYCALEPSIANETGLYYSDCAVASPSPVALSEDDQKRLWDISEETVGLKIADIYKNWVENQHKYM